MWSFFVLLLFFGPGAGVHQAGLLRSFVPRAAAPKFKGLKEGPLSGTFGVIWWLFRGGYLDVSGL